MRPLLPIILALAASTAHAWGTQGHQVIANLAYAQLTAKAKTEVDRLLVLESGATRASISTWADETRNKTTALWHYVNFPRDTCTDDAARDCPDGQCVVGAIDKQLAVLASNAPDERRAARSALEDKARKLATGNFQSKATGIAKDFGFQDYVLREIGVSSVDRGPGPQPRMMAVAAHSTDMASGPYGMWQISSAYHSIGND